MERNSITKESFNFSQVPYNWALCYISECGRKEECMRYQVLHSFGKAVLYICG